MAGPIDRILSKLHEAIARRERIDLIRNDISLTFQQITDREHQTYLRDMLDEIEEAQNSPPTLSASRRSSTSGTTASSR